MILNLVRKLVSGPDELPEIAALRSALSENKADIEKLLKPWDRFNADHDPELKKMIADFHQDITNTELGEKYVLLHAELTAKQIARHALFQLASPIVFGRNTERTRAALTPALQALIGHLETALDKANQHDLEHCHAFGLEHQTGPVAMQLNKSVQDAQNWLKRVATANAHELPGIVNFVLGTSAA